MTNYTPAPPELQPPDSRDYWSTRPPWYAVLAGGGIFVILIVVLALLIAGDDDQIQTVAPTLTSVSSTSDAGSGAATTSTTAASTTSLAPTSDSQSTTVSTSATATGASTGSSTTGASSSTASTATAPDPAAYESAIWPRFESAVRYEDPRIAARGFVEDYVGFDEPLVGPFLPGDGRSGEVEIRPTAAGPVTNVFVRRLGPDDTWWVIGAATEHIVIEVPDALDEVDNPLQVSGEALAFEGVVEVELRADGASVPLVTGTVIGGGTEMQPFDGSFTWTNPGDGSGAVLFLTRSMDDGRVWSASAVRVVFAAD